MITWFSSWWEREREKQRQNKTIVKKKNISLEKKDLPHWKNKQWPCFECPYVFCWSWFHPTACPLHWRISLDVLQERKETNCWFISSNNIFIHQHSDDTVKPYWLIRTVCEDVFLSISSDVFGSVIIIYQSVSDERPIDAFRSYHSRARVLRSVPLLVFVAGLFASALERLRNSLSTSKQWSLVRSATTKREKNITMRITDLRPLRKQ